MAKKQTKTQTKKNATDADSSSKNASATSSTTTPGNDSYVLKLSGKAESPKPLKIGHNIHVAFEGSIISETRTDNEDGSYTTLYAFKPVRISVLDEKGEMIKMKDTRSNSQLIRSMLWKEWANSSSQLDMDFDTFYDRVSKTMMFHMKEIVAWMERENKQI